MSNHPPAYSETDTRRLAGICTISELRKGPTGIAGSPVAIAALPASAATSAAVPRGADQAPAPAEKPAAAPASWCSVLPGAAAANDCRPDNTEDSALSANDDADGLDGIKLGRRLARSTVSKRMVAAREIAGLSQTEAALLVGYAKSGQLSLIEAGAKELPLWALVSAARAYGVSCDFILGCSDEHERDPAAALRSSLVHSVRQQLDAVVGALADSFSSHAAVRHLLDVETFALAVGELLGSIEKAERTTEFQDVPGGAKLLRLADRVRDLHAAMVRAIQQHENRDVQLRRQLAEARNAGHAQTVDESED